jgi:hypothetical protein
VIAGHVAPEEVASARVPERPFREEAAAGDLLEGDVGADDRGQARVSDLETRHGMGRWLEVPTNGNAVLVVAEIQVRRRGA